MAVPRQGIAPEHLRKAIKELFSDVTPGLGSCCNEHITSILFLDERDVPPLAKAAVNHVTGLANAAHTGDIPDPFYIYYTTTRLIAANKKEPSTLQDDKAMDMHPINIRNAWQRVWMKAYFERLIEVIIANTKPCQYGCGEQGGGTEMVFGVKTMMGGAESSMIASVDVAYGYDKIKCSSILQAVWDCPDLRCSYFFFYRILSQSSYIGLGSGAHVINAPFTCDEGVQQGTVKASFLFCAGTNKANQATHHELLESN
eukprot:13826236-Ditylum_brightwellii.AAC.1